VFNEDETVTSSNVVMVDTEMDIACKEVVLEDLNQYHETCLELDEDSENPQ
jgi:hypothetical protein